MTGRESYKERLQNGEGRKEREAGIETVLRSLGSHTERVVGGLVRPYSRGIERDRGKKGEKAGVVNVVKEEAAERVTWKGMFGARDHCDADITTASPKITNILERRSSPVIKDGAYEDIT